MRTKYQRGFSRYHLLRMAFLSCLGASLLTSSSCARSADDSISQSVVTVQCEVPGATPMEVAEMVALPFEQVLENASRVVSVSSESKSGVATIWVQFEPGVSPNEASRTVATSLDQAHLSVLAEDPVIFAGTSPHVLLLSAQVVDTDDAAEGSSESRFDLRSAIVNQVAPRVNRIVGVAEVQCIGGLELRYLVEVDAEKMAPLGLTVDVIERSIGRNWVESAPNESAIDESRDESNGLSHVIESMESITVGTESGESISLRDVATVSVDWHGVEEGAQETLGAVRNRHGDQMVLALRLTPDADIEAVERELDQLVTELNGEHADSFELSRRVDRDQFASLMELTQQRLVERLPIGSTFEPLVEGQYLSGLKERSQGQVVVRFYGTDWQAMREVAINMRELFLTKDSVSHATVVPSELVPELNVRLNEEHAAQFGVTHQTVSRVVSDHLDGRPVMSIQRGRQTQDIVITTRSIRDGLDDFDTLSVRLEDGSAVPLSELASIELMASVPAIYREDGLEVVYLTVTPQDPDKQAELQKLVRDELAKVKSGFEEMGLKWSIRGDD